MTQGLHSDLALECSIKNFSTLISKFESLTSPSNTNTIISPCLSSLHPYRYPDPSQCPFPLIVLTDQSLLQLILTL